MGWNAGRIWQDLVVELLTLQAATATWADGETFFSSSRKYSANAINNKGASALSATTYKAARKAMREYRGHNGRVLGVNPSLLIVGPANEEAGFDILKNELVISGNSNKKNVWFGSADLLVMSELSGDYANYWFLMDTTAILKPVIVQQRKEPTLTRLDKEDDENVFNRDEFVYGVVARGAAAFSMPHLTYGGLVSAS